MEGEHRETEKWVLGLRKAHYHTCTTKTNENFNSLPSIAIVFEVDSLERNNEMPYRAHCVLHYKLYQTRSKQNRMCAIECDLQNASTYIINVYGVVLYDNDIDSKSPSSKPTFRKSVIQMVRNEITYFSYSFHNK